MKKLLFLSLVIISSFTFSQSPEIKPYVDCLKKIEKKSAKDYILEKFQNHDIVILCERSHQDLSQYELIKEILTDEYFKKNVKNLFTEIGTVNLNPEINIFLKTTGLDSIYVEKKLSEFQRNASFGPFWENYNYHYLLRTIYDINNNSDNLISYFPSDVKFDWSKVKDSTDFARKTDKEIEHRDSLIAYNIINRYKKIKSKKNKKALIIMNYRHAFKLNSSIGDKLQKNTGKYLFDYFGNKVTNILINTIIFKTQYNNNKLIQSGKWDAAFKALRIDDIGYDFKNTIFSKDNFDMWNLESNHTYEEFFDGFVFYKPIEKHNLVSYFNGLISEDSGEEILRRFEITLKNRRNYSALKKLNNKDFRAKVLKEFNTKRVRKYPNLEKLIKERDKYLND